MAAGKVYAVKVGRKTGLFHSWDDCNEQVKGYPGAKFKSFKTREEALQWLEDAAGVPVQMAMKQIEKPKESPVENADGEVDYRVDHLDTKELPKVMPKVYAFVDGSYNDNYMDTGKAVYGYGGILHINGLDEPVEGNGCEEEYVVSRQIPGEVFGAIAAMEKAIEHGAEHVVIFYDYDGIGHWATSDTSKRWKANKPIAKEYLRRYEQIRQKIKVNFYHVKAHDNIPGNELADKMAKKQVGKN